MSLRSETIIPGRVLFIKRFMGKVKTVLHKICARTVTRLIISTFIILTIHSISFPIEIHFEGDAPSYLDSHLSERKKRIAKLFGLSQSAETSAVIVTFKKAEASVLGIKTS